MWEQIIETDQIDWNFGNGSTPNRGTGPFEDHSTAGRKGQYIFINSVRSEETQLAVLKSPMLPKYETGGCMRFWYSMYGLDVQTLRIAKEDEIYTFWEAKGNQGLYWKQAAVHFDKADFVRLEGETGRGPIFCFFMFIR